MAQHEQPKELPKINSESNAQSDTPPQEPSTPINDLTDTNQTQASNQGNEELQQELDEQGQSLVINALQMAAIPNLRSDNGLARSANLKKESKSLINSIFSKNDTPPEITQEGIMATGTTSHSAKPDIILRTIIGENADSSKKNFISFICNKLAIGDGEFMGILTPALMSEDINNEQDLFHAISNLRDNNQINKPYDNYFKQIAEGLRKIKDNHPEDFTKFINQCQKAQANCRNKQDIYDKQFPENTQNEIGNVKTLQVIERIQQMREIAEDTGNTKPKSTFGKFSSTALKAFKQFSAVLPIFSQIPSVFRSFDLKSGLETDSIRNRSNFTCIDENSNDPVDLYIKQVLIKLHPEKVPPFTVDLLNDIPEFLLTNKKLTQNDSAKAVQYFEDNMKERHSLRPLAIEISKKLIVAAAGIGIFAAIGFFAPPIAVVALGATTSSLMGISLLGSQNKASQIYRLRKKKREIIKEKNQEIYKQKLGVGTKIKNIFVGSKKDKMYNKINTYVENELNKIGIHKGDSNYDLLSSMMLSQLDLKILEKETTQTMMNKLSNFKRQIYSTDMPIEQQNNMVNILSSKNSQLCQCLQEANRSNKTMARHYNSLTNLEAKPLNKKVFEKIRILNEKMANTADKDVVNFVSTIDAINSLKSYQDRKIMAKKKDAFNFQYNGQNFKIKNIVKIIKALSTLKALIESSSEPFNVNSPKFKECIRSSGDKKFMKYVGTQLEINRSSGIQEIQDLQLSIATAYKHSKPVVKESEDGNEPVRLTLDADSIEVIHAASNPGHRDTAKKIADKKTIALKAAGYALSLAAYVPSAVGLPSWSKCFSLGLGLATGIMHGAEQYQGEQTSEHINQEASNQLIVLIKATNEFQLTVNDILNIDNSNFKDQFNDVFPEAARMLQEISSSLTPEEKDINIFSYQPDRLTITENEKNILPIISYIKGEMNKFLHQDCFQGLDLDHHIDPEYRAMPPKIASSALPTASLTTTTGHNETGTYSPLTKGSGETDAEAPSTKGPNKTDAGAPSTKGSGETDAEAPPAAEHEESNAEAPSTKGSGENGIYSPLMEEHEESNAEAPSTKGSGETDQKHDKQFTTMQRIAPLPTQSVKNKNMPATPSRN